MNKDSLVQLLLTAPELQGKEKQMLVLILSSRTKDDFQYPHVIGEQQNPRIAEIFYEQTGDVVSLHQIKSIMVKCRTVFRFVQGTAEEREKLREQAKSADNWMSLLKWYLEHHDPDVSGYDTPTVMDVPTQAKVAPQDAVDGDDTKTTKAIDPEQNAQAFSQDLVDRLGQHGHLTGQSRPNVFHMKENKNEIPHMEQIIKMKPDNDEIPEVELLVCMTFGQLKKIDQALANKNAENQELKDALKEYVTLADVLDEFPHLKEVLL